MSSPRTLARASARRNRPVRRQTVRNFRTFRGCIYIASPIQTYATPRYDATLDRLRRLLPKAELLPARDLFTSNADWRRRWPPLLQTLDAVVFFDDDNGCIGAGTEQEIRDAWREGMPVYFLPWPPRETLIPCDHTDAVQFWPNPWGGPKQTLHVCYAVALPDALAMVKGGA